MFNIYKHQHEFIYSEAKYPALVAGYGAGKTYALCVKALKECGLNAGYTGLLAEPVYPMVKDVLQPTFEKVLKDSGFDYSYSASDLKYTVKWQGGHAFVLLRSAENYRRWAGLNLAWGGLDEGDLLKTDHAWKMLLSRLRDGNTLRAFVSTTPEGYNWVWSNWVDDPKNGYEEIKASSYDNKSLPSEFLESLEENYDDQLIKAYLHGEFVNLQHGQTYYSFNREKNVAEVLYDSNRPIKIGMDFNVDPITCVLLQEHHEYPRVRVFDEISLRHTGGQELMTQQLCNEIKRKYKNYSVSVYPDPSGKQKRTSAYDTDHDIIRQNGFKLMARNSAPRVTDRVNAVNKIMTDCIIDKKCKGLIRDLEQVVNKEGTREIDKTNKDLTHFSDGFGYYIEFENPVQKPQTRTYTV
ncbi:MAG: hypothetical protein HOK80_02885 [Candidatus Cloacimonetes bacterium]|nr:hypothetical protein [Candidatus Cloacimonadota bacterium]